MYYSIYIETRGLISSIILLDKTDLDHIKNDIILPFSKNEFFIVDGNKLRETDVKVIKVVSTDAPIKKSLKLRKSTNFNSDEIRDIREVIYDDANDITNDLFSEVRKESRKNTSGKKMNSTYDNRSVFIVHGHDKEKKLEVARFIEKLGLNAIILDEQANNGMTIIEKIDKYTNVGFGIVLYTPCDKGGTADASYETMQFRARQNVILEHGYLMGKIGRDRVCALLDGDIEKPSDIQGIVYISYQENWQIKIAQELKLVGYEIDLNKII